MTRTPCGTATSLPTAAILPSRTSTVPPSIRGPAAVKIVALTMAKGAAAGAL
jgi:hypothetical protein